MSITTLISKLLSLFVASDKGQVHQVDISSSLAKLAQSSSLASLLSEPSSLSFSNVGGEGEEVVVKSPMAACRCAIWPTQVFTWHNLSLRVSRWASMCTSYAMMASNVTPPTEDKGAEVDGAVEARGAAVYVWGRLGLSRALLRRTVEASMAPIMEKWGETMKETKKWWSVHVIAEGKMSLSRVAVSL